MTATQIGVEVSCDGPDEHTDCPDSAAVRASFASRTARQVRADGRAQGWTTRRAPGQLEDMCPSCTAKRQDEAQP
ncbi:hypothetical protein ACH49_13585 [Streptomyces leeuwenhoekii]|uniref:Uncharacterized protein n=1 Tax=Streptomyces leeuwenhoekii TaxID=1437453 RepID=A0ABR5HZ79_STRLW|nr:hypothetical protein [Streptomyces leeuwenhoekii]KMS79083.1 hypothetical protein ACH49_13585 [Streptomyces leeuwenhoekii]